jgi:predicted ferric reductase
MGPNTWTHKLAELTQRSNSRSAFVATLDGPYGRPTPLTAYSAVLMVAGGIGITPLLSQFSELYAQACAATKGGAGSELEAEQSELRGLRSVHLVWCVREAREVALFGDTFRALTRLNPGNAFRVSVYRTRPSKTPVANSGVEEFESMMHTGRPDWHALFLETKQHAAPRSGAAAPCATVCGPSELTDEISEQCFRHNFAFHSETFLL